MHYVYVGLAAFVGGVVVSYLFRKREENIISTVKADVASQVARLEAKLASGVSVAKSDVETLLAKVKSIL